MRTQILSVNEKFFWVCISGLIFATAWALCALITLSHADGHAHQHTHSFSEDRLLHGKPGSEWRLLSEPIQALTQGETRQVTLQLNTSGNKGTLDLSLKHDDGMALLDASSNQIFDLNGEAHIDIPVTIYAAEPGEHLLHVLVQFTDKQGLTIHRAIAMAVQVDVTNESIAQERSTRLKSAANRDLITLKAQETIY